MAKEIKISLSKSGIKELKEKILSLQKSLNEAADNITKELADYTYNEVQNNINNTQYKDGNDDISAFKQINSSTAKVGMRGSQVLYDEYGTGTQGEQSSHPLKGEFSLNAYNSGKKIRTSSGKGVSGFAKGVKYWTYKNKNGDIIYTTGIPAGKQVYNASKALRKAKKGIIKKEMGDILSKL